MDSEQDKTEIPPPLPVLPPLSEHERAAVVGLLVRHAATWWDRNKHREEKEKIEKLIAEKDGMITNCEAGMKAFGLDVDRPEVWTLIREHFENDVVERLRWTPSTVDKPSAQEIVNSLPTAAVQRRERVQDILLQHLEELGGAGGKAAQLREHVEAKLGREVHDKTVGMSLYRLLNKGRVRRTGHTWYFASRTKNPDAGASGLRDLLE